jgi:cell surface protein SprA
LSISQDYARRKTFNISNAGFTNRGEKPHFWDPANFSFNYTFNEVYRSSTKTEIDLEKTIRGGIFYTYESQPPNIVPFKSVKFLNSPLLRIVKDFNFYLWPKSVSFRTDLERFYHEIKTRNINNPYLLVTPTFRKDFEWTTMYDIKYDLTRQLKVDFLANNIARIDEPPGGVDKERYEDEYQDWRDSVMYNIRNFGRTINYNHFINVNYNIPVNKLPLLSWLNSNLRYGADYTWLAGSLFPDSMDINLGNTIKNHNDLTLSVNATLTTLYNRSKFLKEIENSTRPEAQARRKQEFKTVTYRREKVNLRPGVARAIYHNLKTRDISVKVTAADGSELKGKMDIVSDSRINFTVEEQADNVTFVVEGKVPKKRSPLVVTGEYLVRFLMGVRNISLSLTDAHSQLLPGYLPRTEFLGLQDYNGTTAPGWPFILGYSDENFFEKAASRGWLTTDTLINTPAFMSSSQTISLRTLFEPFPGLRADITADRRFVEAVTAYYTADRNGNFPDSTRNKVISGNFTISVISWGTSFEKITKDNDYVSPTFEAFKSNTVVISERRANERGLADPGYDPDIDPVTGEPIEGPYKNGYGPTSREVLIPAFLAAYTKSDPKSVTLETFPSAFKMMPNWRINFDGLSRFKFIQSVLRSVSLLHQYRSTYNITSFTTNLKYQVDATGMTSQRDLQQNFIPQYEINVVTVNEQFSPLINIDLNWKSSLTTRIEVRKSRTVSLNLVSNQVADARSNELVLGAGYRFDDVQIMVRTGGAQRALKSDLNLRLDLSIRDNKTVARKLVENVNQPVVGQKIFTIGATADYLLSDRFNLQIFADHTMNNPFVANTFPTSATNIGFSLKFTLVQ